MKKGEISIGLVGDTVFPDKGYIEREDGRVAIKHAIGGQKVEYCITKKRAGEAQGRVLRVLEPSSVEDRKNLCNFAGICGGCLYQSVGYQHQLDIKEEQLKKLLKDEEFIWEGIQASPAVEGYRNKMEFSFGDSYKDGPLALGMHKRGSHYDIVTSDSCQIVHMDFNVILRATLAFFSEAGIPYLHKLTHSGFLRHLLIRRSAKSGEILVDLITTTSFGKIEDPNREEYIPPIDEEAKKIIKEWKDVVRKLEDDGKMEGRIAGILHTVNNSYADAVIDQGTSILYGQDFITENLLGLDFKITPFSFFQTNSLGAELLYQVAGRYIGDTQGKAVFDLYSGTGTIAQLLAGVAQEVYGVEIVEEAVRAARENAKKNGIDNCTFIAGDVLKVIDDLQTRPDIIVLDPPREGIHPKALPKIMEYQAERIVYISCKPSSLARDILVLKEGGYHLKKACAVDMFPFTANCEAVALFEKMR